MARTSEQRKKQAGPSYFSAFGGLWPDRTDAADEMKRRVNDGRLTASDRPHIEQWMRDGYTIVENAVDLKDIAAYSQVVDECFRGHADPRLKMMIGGDGEATPFDVAKVRPESSVRILDHYAYSEEARRLLMAPAITQYLTRLFDGPPLLFQSLGFEYGSQQGMHQDTAYVVANQPMTIVGVWIAIEDVQEGSGELQYYRGSHRLPEFRFSGQHKSWDPARDGMKQHQDWAAAIHSNAKKMGLEKETFRPKRGSVLFWHADLAHGGSPITRPGATRRSLVGHFCPANVMPHYYSYNPERAHQEHYRDAAYSSVHYNLQRPLEVVTSTPAPESTVTEERTPMVRLEDQVRRVYGAVKPHLPEQLRTRITSLAHQMRPKVDVPPRATAVGAPQAHDFWGKKVEAGTVPPPMPVEVNNLKSVQDAFLGLNALYLKVFESPLVRTDDHHVQKPACYADVLSAFQNSGLPMDELAIDAGAFQAFLDKSLELYRQHGDYLTHQGGLKGYFPQKALEHWISAEVLKWSPTSRVLDFAAWVSPAVEVLSKHRPADFYKHDIMLTTDLSAKKVSGWSDAVEAPDEYFDFIMAHCSIDNFEKDFDTKFFKEVRRMLKPGGKVLITPLHMSARYENRVAIGSPGVSLDSEAELVIGPPNSLRFARLYSVDALKRRVIEPSAGLNFKVIHVTGLPTETYQPTCTNRFMLVGTKTS